MDIERIKELLNHTLIISAGLCSAPPMIEDGTGDIDIFVYCTSIPPEKERQSLLSDLTLNYIPGEDYGRWGICDLAYIDGEEVWFMYVTVEETEREVSSILAGKMPDKLDNYYYPTGRLATIRNLKVIFDRSGFLERLKETVSVYPDKLREKLISFHTKELLDTEDIERAVKRKDILFYHFALDITLDHFLQALFAFNRVYFPSRKKNLKYIKDFEVKPENCEDKLAEIISTGGKAESLEASFELVKELIEWTYLTEQRS